jgi:tripartite-type tricarboxylate transporter receptor subunit TctC
MKGMSPNCGALAVLALSFVFAQGACAQSYPSQYIQMIITTTPGDTQDLSGRAIGSELSRFLKTPIVPVNKMGAAGAVGADYVVKAKKDGYTVLYINSSLIYTYALSPDEVPYNPFKDLDPLCLAVSVPLLIAVQSESPWNSIQDLVGYVKQHPGKVRGSSTGVGSVGHFGYEVIRAETGAGIEMIPFKGAAPGIAALIGGHVEVAIPSPTLVLPLLKTGKVRVLLISKKAPDFPQTPTLTELGYKHDIPSVWYGLFLPVGVPEPVKRTLVSALEKSIKSPELSGPFRNLGAVVDYRPGEEFTKMMSDEYETIRKLLKNAPSSK